ncbi:MAG TPA: sterol desaturase family protein, partial [Mucilaginibacter sp.]
LKYLLNSPELHLWHHANYTEVFHANFSTKFAVWDYLLGTVYDPGHKPGNQPENWGLYYPYPKDYFLQHAFSVKRFDEQKLLKYKWFKWYYELRPNLITAFKGFAGLNKTKENKPVLQDELLVEVSSIKPEDTLISQAS